VQAAEVKMEKDIKAVIVMLATQSMINLGEIRDPLSGESKNDLEGARTFIQLIEVLGQKTKGNLTPEEEKFLLEVKNNLTKVYNKKLNKNPG
jgi:hypothetical protein